MSINVNAFEKQLRNRLIERKFEVKPIGTMLKFRRQELQMTLEEAAEDICSVSYLSKLENNLVELSDRFADALYQRLDLKTDQHHDVINLEYIYHSIISDILSNEAPKAAFFEDFEHKIDHQSQLMMMAHAWFFNDFLAMKHIFERQIPFLVQFSDLEIALHTYLAIDMLYQEGYFDKAHQMMKSLPYEKCASSQLILLYKKMHLRLALKMHKTKEIEQIYQDLFTLLSKRQLFNHLAEIQYEHLMHQSMYQSKETIEARMAEMHQLSDEQRQYIKALLFICDKSYKEAFATSRPFANQGEGWQIIRLICLEQISSGGYELQKCVEAFQPKTLEGKKLKAYLGVKHDQSFNEFLEYVRKELLYPAHGINDYLIFKHIMISAYHHLSSHHYYKDASKILERFHHINVSLTASSVSF